MDELSDQSLNLNFLPISGLDTGGNWDTIYGFVDQNDIKCSYEKRRYNNQASSNMNEILQLDMYELIDNKWLHSVNASNWYGNLEASNLANHSNLFSMLDQILVNDFSVIR